MTFGCSQQDAGVQEILAARKDAEARRSTEPTTKESELRIERLPSRSAAVVSVNAGGGPRFAFNLTDTAGELVRPSDFKGRLVLMFFGDARCEMTCTQTLERLSRVESALGVRPSQLAFVMVSTDGDRDAPGELHRFATRKSPNVIGLTGDPEAVRSLAGKFDIEPQSHEAGHDSDIVVLDTRGGWLQTIASDASAEDIADVLRPLLAQQRGKVTQR